MKKIFTLLWGISVVALSTISCTFAYTQEQQEAYQWAYQHGITTQPTIEAANLNWNLTRQAFAKMVVNYLEAAWVKQTTSVSCAFPDENKITNDLKPYVRKTCALKIMWSNWVAFKPTDSVDRAQLWTVLSRILWWEEYNSNGKWYYIYHLNALKQSGIMNNINNPQAYAKRWDVLIMLKRMYEKYGSNVNMNGSNITVYTEASTNTSNNVSNNTSVVRKTDSNGFSYYDSYLDNPRLSNAMKEMKLRSTNCSNIFCQQVGDDGTYSNQKHYYWNDKEWTMTLIPWVYHVSDCAYYDWIYGDSSSSYTIEYDDYDDYNTYSSSNVVYTWKDWTQYVYDVEFLNLLKNEADKKWESDLSKYLGIEAEYFASWLDQLESLDLDNLPEMLGIDEDLDPETMTKKEKEALLKKIKNWVSELIQENKDRNDEYVKKLEKVTKNISNDKFWLKEKFEQTKKFMDTTDSFLVLYSEIIFEVMEMALTSEDWEIDDEAWMGIVFWLMWAALAYEGEVEEYQAYLEDWATKTIKLLNWELSTNNTNNNSTWNKKANSKDTKNNVDNSNETMFCTLSKTNFMSWTSLESTYKINYNGEYVNSVDTVEIVNSDDEQVIEYYKDAVEELYKPYKNLKYYDYDIKATKDTLTSKVTINYEKIDMDKFVEINPEGAAFFVKDNKISLEKLVEYYEMIGATCK